MDGVRFGPGEFTGSGSSVGTDHASSVVDRLATHTSEEHCPSKTLKLPYNSRPSREICDVQSEWGPFMYGTMVGLPKIKSALALWPARQRQTIQLNVNRFTLE
jgi:hypothetical protein